MPRFGRSIGFGLVLLLAGTVGAAGPVVETEEVVGLGAEPNNGAGPLWCYGAPLIARAGDDLFASLMEAGDGVPPLSNTRWRVLRRGASGWVEVARADRVREREPCPLAWAGRSGLILSVNPSLEPETVRAGRADPHLLRFDASNVPAPPGAIRPPWPASARFTEHSYRGLATDPARGDVLALNIDAATEAQRWAFLPGDGAAARTGEVRFPIRACYPQVAIRGGSAHVLALGDIGEPVVAWRDFKKAATGRTSDFVFRRLFHARAADLGSGDFDAPTEVESVEATGGDLRNLDLWLDAGGAAHLLYLKITTVSDLRDRFFPGRPIRITLEHAVASGGRVEHRPPLLVGGEGRPETPRYARFHALADGTVLVVAAVSTAAGLENRLIPIGPGPSVRLPLQTPFSTFFTATERGGSPPSDTLDLFGQGGSTSDLRYARVRLR